MDAFLTELKNAARARSWFAAGPGTRRWTSFILARRDSTNGIVLLLVDAEGPVGGAPSTHLNLDDLDDDVIHLMIEIMETWIVADEAALRDYYGQHFDARALPKSQQLERVPKTRIIKTLDRATRATQKGRYHKIRHAGDLLRRIDPNKVRGRCPSCKRLFETLNRVIAATG